MAMDMMADLVREHHLHLFGRELIHERVAEQNPSRSAQARKSGVGFPRLRAQVKTIDSLDVEARAENQFLKTLQERGVIDGSEFIEERQDQHRHDTAQDEGRQEPAGRRPQPPQRAAKPKKAIESVEQKQTYGAADQIAFNLHPGPLQK